MNGGQFKPGNKAGAKPRLFDAALRRAIAQDDGKRIRACAERLLDLASEGEQWAVKELAERLDGKSVAYVESTIDGTLGIDIANVERLKAKIAAVVGQDDGSDRLLEGSR